MHIDTQCHQMLIDTHCHLGDRAFDGDRTEVVARAAAADIGHIVVIAESAEATTRARALAGPGLSASAGVHPHEASSWNAETAASVREALEDPIVVAVGETGLDYHYNHAPREVQRAAFEAQLVIAAEKGLPVVVHARDADDDMAAMLRAHGSAVPALVLHSFSSGAAVFDAGMEIGAYFGWSGMVTFKNWELSDRLCACPTDRMLLETDAPYLAPIPHRGKRNEPAFVRHVAVRVAEMRDITLHQLVDATTANATRCFGTRVTQPLPRTS